jgi:predicted DNA-binding transcriptional regulator AlpA
LSYQSPAPDSLEVRVDLTATDADVLADVLQEAAELAADSGGRGTNLPFIGSSEAAKILGVEPPTIRAWVAGRGPAKHPFPRPVIRMQGRNLWRRRAVEKWKAEQDAFDKQDVKPSEQLGP